MFIISCKFDTSRLVSDLFNVSQMKYWFKVLLMQVLNQYWQNIYSVFSRSSPYCLERCDKMLVKRNGRNSC